MPKLTALVSIPTGTGRGRTATGEPGSDAAGWTGKPRQPGDALTTTDDALAAYLVRFGYARDADAAADASIADASIADASTTDAAAVPLDDSDAPSATTPTL